MNKKRLLYTTVLTATVLMAVATTSACAQSTTLGIRTNLLSWTVLSPSLGVDLQWGTRWQAGIDGSIGLSSTNPDGGTAKYARISSIGAQVRRYIGASATHSGLFVGASARHMHVNYKLKKNGIGREGSVNTIGITGGYTMKLGGAFSADAAIGAGYLHRYYNRYEWYVPQQQNRLVDRRNKGALGITHAELSLVYNFNLK